MVSIARRFQIFVLLLFCASLHAKDLSAYNVGDVADADITTPVAFDAIDPVATAAKKAEQIAKTPVIFRNFPSVADEITNNFLDQFDKARQNFLAAVNKKFQTTVLDASIIASPDFADVLGAFNKKDKSFPLTTNLAKAWAKNDSGAEIESAILKRFADALHRPIHADALSDGFTIGETVRVINSKNADEPLTIADVETRGKLGTATSVTTLTHARSILRKSFPDDEQTFAHAMMALLKPTAVLDEPLTKQSRDAVATQISVPVHYEAGQIIVRHGEVIDEKIKSALDQLAKNDAAIQLINEQAKKAQAQVAQAQQQTQLAREQAQKIQQQADAEREQVSKIARQSRSHEAVLFAEIGGVSVFAIIAVVVVLFFAKSRQSAIPAPATGNGAIVATPSVAVAGKKPVASGIKINIPSLSATPAVSPSPAREPQTAQEIAEAEIAQLSQRLDKLYAPPHDRLRTYQLRLEDFERELAQHGVQNPELIKLKIAAIGQQMETERKRFHL